MASFVGTLDDFIKYISPRARNVVNSITRKYKKEIGQCEQCKSHTVPLEAAHVTGRERAKIIADILMDFTNDEVITIDLDVFESRFLEAHEPIEDNIRVLCRPCHRDYDAPKDDSIAGQFEASDSADGQSDIENLFISNSEITTFLRQVVPQLNDSEVRKLTNAEYCKDVFKVHKPVLKSIPFDSDKETVGQLARDKGYIRWSPKSPIVRNSSKYLVLTQWFDRNRLLFLRWKKDIENA